MQFETFSFGIDNVTFITDDKEVYGLDDPTNGSLDMSFEVAEKRGGANNDLRSTAIHSRKGSVKISTGRADISLVKLLTGGTITSLGASAASVTTHCSTLYGATATIPTAVVSTTITSAIQAKTTDYYLKATSLSAVELSRTSDGKVFGPYTLTASGTIVVVGEGITLWTGATGCASLTTDEKAYISVRSAINSFNQRIDLDATKPLTMACRISADFDGVKTIIEVPNIQPKGMVQQMSATEFSINEMEMPIFNSQELDRIASIIKQS